LSALAEVKQYSFKVVDFTSKSPIENAFVRVVDLTKNKVNAIQSDNTGKVAMELDLSSHYRIDVGKRTNEEGIKYITYSFFLGVNDISKPTVTEVMLEKVKVNSQINLSNLYFEPGKAELDGNDKIALANALIALNTSPSLIIEIGIRADCKESEDIAAQRTELIQQYFATKGDYAKRIVIKNYGKSSQLAGCNCDSPTLYTDEIYSANRVAEFKVLSF
jgi:outer membrane protein OmpA-like peptidoglycan-associated protein